LSIGLANKSNEYCFVSQVNASCFKTVSWKTRQNTFSVKTVLITDHL